MDAAEGWVLDEGPFYVHRLELFPIFLVEEGDGHVVGQSKGLVEERQSLAVTDEPDAAEKDDSGRLLGAANLWASSQGRWEPIGAPALLCGRWGAHLVRPRGHCAR